MEKEINLSNCKVKIRELRYLDGIENQASDKKEWFKTLLKNSIVEPTPTDEFLNNLTFKDGNLLIKEINVLNGLTPEPDFQNPSNQD